MSQQAFDPQANELERLKQAGAIEPQAQESQDGQSVGADGDLERSLKRACLLYTSPSPRDRG